MNPLGFDQPLYILPFDHRATFEIKMFGWHEPLSAAQTGEIASKPWANAPESPLIRRPRHLCSRKFCRKWTKYWS